MADHRKRITEMLIKQALIQLLMEKPLSNITVKELCIEAGINRGTFYNNYNDIFDLLRQIQEELLNELSKRLEVILTDEITPFTISIEILNLIKENSEFLCVTLGPHGDRAFMREIFDLGRNHAMQNYKHCIPNVSEEKLKIHYTFVSAGCGALAEQWLLGQLDLSSEEMGRTMGKIISSGSGYLLDN